MRFLLYALLAAGAALILWQFATRPVSLVIDRLHTVVIESPPLDHFRYNNSVLELGRLRLYTSMSEFGLSADVTVRSGKRAVIESGGRSFAFGPARSASSASGFAVIDFNPDAGDAVSFTIERSLLSLPTTFETNFMTGRVPSARRHVYCRLRWAKRSGGRLEMLWRDEQLYWPEAGWVPARIEANTNTLMRVAISGTTGLEEAAVQYLGRTKHWKRSEYRLEDRGPASDATEEILFAVHRDDQQSTHPGAGLSVELRIDYRKRQVTRETAGQ